MESAFYTHPMSGSLLKNSAEVETICSLTILGVRIRSVITSSLCVTAYIMIYTSYCSRATKPVRRHRRLATHTHVQCGACLHDIPLVLYRTKNVQTLVLSVFHFPPASHMQNPKAYGKKKSALIQVQVGRYEEALTENWPEWWKIHKTRMCWDFEFFLALLELF